jgi:hypothetical protein
MALVGCYRKGPPPNTIPTPTPIDAINSEFDDVNASDPGIPYRSTLIFSTNRASKGGDFDLWTATLQWSEPEGDAPATISAFAPPASLAGSVNSPQNDRSPIALVDDDWFGYYGLLAFSSDRDGGKGGFDLYAVPCSRSYYDDCSPMSAPVPFALNTPADEMYLTRAFAPRTLLFASNRDSVMGGGPAQGPHDLYLARWPLPTTKNTTAVAQRDVDLGVKGPDAITNAPAELHRVDELSSEGDDTAPFVYKSGDTPEVVFVSDRPGSLGQHDIYCSRFTKGAWSAPKHLDKVSSASDELRPIVMDINHTRFMLFSSNRPGGKGGYDLYAVGYSGCR